MIRNKTALTAAGGTPPSGPFIALGVSRDLRNQSSDGPGEINRRNALPRIAQAVKRIRDQAETANSRGVPDPSDALHPHGSLDIRELAAFVFVGAFCAWVAVAMMVLTHIPFLDFFDLG